MSGDAPRLSGFERWAWRSLGRWARRPELEETLGVRLRKARSRLTAGEYRALTLTSTAIAAALGIGGGAFAAFALSGLFGASGAWALALGLPLALAGGTYASFEAAPGVAARERARRLEQELGPTANFASAMSCAEVRVDEIFRALAEQPIYGAVAQEAAEIVRDTDRLGIDLLGALRRAALDCPSSRFEEFLQGIVTTSEAGGELKPYFLARSEQYAREAELGRLEGVERLAVFAESFVTVGIAFPLFLIVLLAVLAVVASSTPGLVLLLWVTVLGILPAILLAFGLAARVVSERM